MSDWCRRILGLSMVLIFSSISFVQPAQCEDRKATSASESSVSTSAEPPGNKPEATTLKSPPPASTVSSSGTSDKPVKKDPHDPMMENRMHAFKHNRAGKVGFEEKKSSNAEAKPATLLKPVPSEINGTWRVEDYGEIEIALKSDGSRTLVTGKFKNGKHDFVKGDYDKDSHTLTFEYKSPPTTHHKERIWGKVTCRMAPDRRSMRGAVKESSDHGNELHNWLMSR